MAWVNGRKHSHSFGDSAPAVRSLEHNQAQSVVFQNAARGERGGDFSAFANIGREDEPADAAPAVRSIEHNQAKSNVFQNAARGERGGDFSAFANIGQKDEPQFAAQETPQPAAHPSHTQPQRRQNQQQQFLAELNGDPALHKLPAPFPAPHTDMSLNQPGVHRQAQMMTHPQVPQFHNIYGQRHYPQHQQQQPQPMLMSAGGQQQPMVMSAGGQPMPPKKPTFAIRQVAPPSRHQMQAQPGLRRF